MKRLTPGKLIIYTAALLMLSCIVVAVTVVSRFLAPYLGGDSLTTQLSKLKASGEPISMAELVGPAIPDSQNGALIYQKAFKQIGLPKNRQRFKEEIDSLIADSKSGKADAYPKMKKFVSQYQSLITLVEKAASCPKCRFSIKWDAGLDADLSHGDSLRCLSKLLACNAIVEAREGRMESAVHINEVAFKLPSALEKEPGIISFLIRMSMIESACSSIEDILISGTMTDKQARRLYGSLSAIKLNTHYKLAFRGERIQGINFLKQLADGKTGSIVTNNRYALSGFAQTLLRPDRTYFLDTTRRQIDYVDMPYRVLKARKTDEIFERGIPKLSPVSSTFLLHIGKVNARRDSILANISTSQVALALKVFHNATGTYPSSLSKLKTLPGFNLNLQDPFSGKDFVYKRKGNGYLLYSIGKNLKDEGGLDDYKPARRTSHPKTDKPDDIVWKIER